MTDYPQIVYKKHTFLSALVMGLTALLITLIISCTVVVVYGMHFAGDKSEELVSLAKDAIRGLPALQESLPPVLADILDDRRQPDYSSQLEIRVNKTTLLPEGSGEVRTAVTVVNNGEEVVSVLSLRIVILNEHDEIVAEANKWVATPFAAEDDWPGPLMPGSRRHFAFSRSGAFPVSSLDDLRTEIEITDIRIWSGQKETSVIEEQVPAEIETSESYPTEPIEE